MIDKKFKQKWLKALRSRKYKQTHMALHNSDGYCCLGVACVVARAKESNVYGTDIAFYYKGDHDTVVLPDALREEIGLSNEEQEILYTLNDGGRHNGKDVKKHKFGQIARWIEKHL